MATGKVVGKVDRQKGFLYFVDGEGKVIEKKMKWNKKGRSKK